MAERAAVADLILRTTNNCYESLKPIEKVKAQAKVDKSFFNPDDRLMYTQTAIKLAYNARHAVNNLKSEPPNMTFYNGILNTPHTQIGIDKSSLSLQVSQCVSTIDVLVKDDSIEDLDFGSGPSHFRVCSKCKKPLTPRMHTVRSADEGISIVGWDCTNKDCF